jgi:uncharacterized membrane protein (UPF0127 family)
MILTVTKATSVFQKTKGLLGADKPYPLLFNTRFGIHTFGMRFPIDVVILDANNMVVAGKENLQPNRLFFWNPKFNTVIELPIGTIQQNKIEKGSVIELQIMNS